MNNLKNRLDMKLARYGVDVELNGTDSLKAFVQELTGSLMSVYLDSADQSQMTKPGLYLVVSADAPVAPGDTVALDGRDFTVSKILKQRMLNQVVFQALVLY